MKMPLINRSILYVINVRKRWYRGKLLKFNIKSFFIRLTFHREVFNSASDLDKKRYLFQLFNKFL